MMGDIVSESIKHVTDATYQSDVLDAEGAVLVDFWAPWCGPCRMLAPVIEDLARDYGDKMTFVKMNTDEYPATPESLGIRGIPTLILYVNGVEVDRKVGFAPKPQIEQTILALLEKAQAQK